MRNLILFVLGLMLVGAAIPGCGVHQGEKMVTYSSNTTELPKPVTVNKVGTYALYPDDGLTPLERVELKAGEKIGFRHAGDGQVVAFAADKEFPLNAVLAQEYIWKYQGEK